MWLGSCCLFFLRKMFYSICHSNKQVWTFQRIMKSLKIISVITKSVHLHKTWVVKKSMENYWTNRKTIFNCINRFRDFSLMQIWTDEAGRSYSTSSIWKIWKIRSSWFCSCFGLSRIRMNHKHFDNSLRDPMVDSTLNSVFLVENT